MNEPREPFRTDPQAPQPPVGATMVEAMTSMPGQSAGTSTYTDPEAERVEEVRGRLAHARHEADETIHDITDKAKEMPGRLRNSARKIGEKVRSFVQETREMQPEDRKKRIAKISGFTAIAGFIGMRAKRGMSMLKERRHTPTFESRMRKAAHRAKETTGHTASRIRERATS